MGERKVWLRCRFAVFAIRTKANWMWLRRQLADWTLRLNLWLSRGRRLVQRVGCVCAMRASERASKQKQAIICSSSSCAPASCCCCWRCCCCVDDDDDDYDQVSFFQFPIRRPTFATCFPFLLRPPLARRRSKQQARPSADPNSISYSISTSISNFASSSSSSPLPLTSLSLSASLAALKAQRASARTCLWQPHD